MDARRALIRLTREHTKSFIKAARCLPADKLTWKAAAGNRTPLDVLQEVATIARGTPDIVRNRTMVWSQEEFQRGQVERAKLTDFDEIIAALEATTDLIVATIEATAPEQYDDPVEMPWPEDFRVVDILAYHSWNLGYHEGQLVYILTVLSNGIENGEDKLNERYLLGTNLIRSTMLYCLVALFVMVLFNIIASAIMGVTVGVPT